ncbi:MAG: hypothetical protein KME07_21375 [Pegethrix bostrychoides GSE-TBD4-15B]|jgi:hypothetical protein|uniref:Uncharacterized protein n=1 Tax=Pegethrix bostrychoides GSE-TBD4-15B TaxID=2839662 RepID=A0A951U6T1_9CYAN|nr:hypothetical protein [Pegethrix bostrychoides GSE-TBD4-15B]
MDVSNCYHLAQDLQLCVEYNEQHNAYTASILQEGRDTETLVKLDPSLSDSNHWFETIDAILPYINRSLEALNIEFTIPDEDLEEFRSQGEYNDYDFVPWIEPIEDLEMTDSEYTSFIASGYDPMTQSRLWRKEEIKQELIYLVSQISQAENKEEVEHIIQMGAVKIASEAKGLLAESSVEDALLKSSYLSKKDFIFLNDWVKDHFGVALTDFPSLIDSGVNPMSIKDDST